MSKSVSKGKTSGGTLSSSMDIRIRVLFVSFLLLGFALLFRLYFLQVVRGEYYSALALGQKIKPKVEDVPRGEIYFQDKAGEALYIAATTKEMFMVYADPKEVEDEEHTLNQLKTVVDVSLQNNEKTLERLRNKKSSYAVIANQLSDEQASSIKNLNLKGIYLKKELVRAYPAQTLASHVLGFVGFQGDAKLGQYGIEEKYDDKLRANIINSSLFSKLFPEDYIDSTNIELTIDYGAQFIVEKKLKEVSEKLDAEGASAIFMDPKTGEIIAMANYPSFNPNKYSEEKGTGLFKNSAVQSVYEFGSVFKPITMAAAIDARAVGPETTYNDTGSVQIGGYSVKNFDGKARGIQTMTQVLESSLNTGAMFAQEQLGKKKFKDYLEAFQFDKKTGIDLPGEVTGNISNIQNTNRDINFATASFGQGINFSSLRFLTSFSAIANQGIIMKPYIVKKIITENGQFETKSEEVARPISPTTASRVTAMLVSTVKNGYDKKVSVPAYTVAGKTGTAQVPNEGASGYSDKVIHSFIGFAPAYDPRFVGFIRVDNPKGIRFAADSITPTFSEIALFLLNYYKIPPQ